MEVILAVVGRLVPEKGATDAVRLLAQLSKYRAARLVLAGSGPDAGRARDLAGALGVSDRLELRTWGVRRGHRRAV